MNFNILLSFLNSLFENKFWLKNRHVILDKLFSFVLMPNVSTHCLEVTCRLIQRVTFQLSGLNDAHKRNRLLVQYVKYSCNIESLYSTEGNNKLVQQQQQQQKTLFHEKLLSEWLQLLIKK
jgi:hypothetical protein